MSCTPASLRARFPGVFDSVAEAALQGACDEAELTVNRKRLGSRADMAVLYFAAHLAESTKPGRVSGAISQSAGSMSISFGRPGGTSFLELYERIISSGGGASLAVR